MKLDKRLFAVLGLTLAGTMLWADLSWAQGRRGGGGPGCPMGQTSQGTGQGQGQGQGNLNCPNYPGYGNSPQGSGGKGRGFQGQRGPGQNAPSPPANPSNVTQ